MKLSLKELKIIEPLLSNRLNADFDPDVEKLLHKIRKEIKERNNQYITTMECARDSGKMRYE